MIWLSNIRVYFQKYRWLQGTQVNISPLKKTGVLFCIMAEQVKLPLRFQDTEGVKCSSPSIWQSWVWILALPLTAETLRRFPTSLILLTIEENSNYLPLRIEVRINWWQSTQRVSSVPGHTQCTQSIFDTSFKIPTVTKMISPLRESVHKDNTYPWGCFLHLISFLINILFMNKIKKHTEGSIKIIPQRL